MIASILDQDSYKLNTQNAILQLYPHVTARYTFINRGEQRFNDAFITRFVRKLRRMGDIVLAQDEADYLAQKCPFLPPAYIEYLKQYRFNPGEVHTTLHDDGTLIIYVDGLWHRTVLWEVPLLALISETYFETVDTNWRQEPVLYRDQTEDKISTLARYGCKVADYGTRRRRDLETQAIVIEACRKYPNFVGTSNVMLARMYNVTPLGSMPHEWIMAMSVLEGLRHANRFALENWIKVYNASLGTALTDTYGLDAFLKDFDMKLAKLYDGTRQDSGSPFEFVDKMFAHYKSLRIDPLSKHVIFSNRLNSIQSVVRIQEYCQKCMQPVFGIGTWLTNDFAFCGSPALDIVIKLWAIDGIPVVKLPDDAAKVSGDPDAVRVARWTFQNTPLDKC